MARLNRGQPDEGLRLHQSIFGDAPGLTLPSVSSDLLKYLDHVFPNRINAAWTELEFREACGARAVVDHLRQLYEEQEKSDVPGR
ncbi:hypothetical protein [Roseixanthobacter pseudopolyaromaticivorans]|uniref:hypothetical protein n=1 Tax=Xanthobacteraceae TaxID=335928 RepID=UPI0037289E4A